MSPQLENALMEALDLLEQGTPIVKILARYPDLSEELRPYLITAVDLTQLAMPSTVAAQQRSKDGFLRQAAALQVEHTPSARSSWLQRALAIGLAALLFLLVSGSMLAFASEEALPGDTLYGTKLILEQMQLTYSANPETASAMIERYHQERVDEVAALLALNRRELVTFSGTVEEISEDRWLVEGIPVAIMPATVVPDGIKAGFLVQITGTTGDGVVTADRVEVVHGNLPEPELNDPVPPAQPSPAATPTPSREPSATPARSAEDTESNPSAGALTPAPTDDFPEMPGTGNISPGEDGRHDENEIDDDSSSRPDDNSDEQDDGDDQSDDSSDQQESEEDSGSNSGSGGDERESEDSSQEEKDAEDEDKSGKTEEDKDNSGNDEEDKKDSSDEQGNEEENDDSSADSGDDAKEEDSHEGNSGKGSGDESEDKEKHD